MYPVGSILRHYPSTPPQPEHHTHYSAIVLKNSILQVKPTRKHFSSIENWCNAMHQPPADTKHLLQHHKALDEITRKYHITKNTLRKLHWTLQRILYKQQSAEHRLTYLQNLITYHQQFLP